MNKLIYFITFSIILSSLFVVGDDLMSLTGSFINYNNGTEILSDNLVIELYDQAAGGNLIFNSTSDFNDNITAGTFDIMIGLFTQKLNINYSQNLFMDIFTGGQGREFQGQDRQIFQSPTGNVTHERLFLADTIQTQDVVPHVNSTYDLGSQNKTYANLFTGIIQQLTNIISGKVDFSGDINLTTNSNIFLGQAGNISFNGTCTIIGGLTSILEVC